MFDNGIEALLLASMAVYTQAARRTGRTTRMIEACKDGDIVICPNDQTAYYVRKAASAAGKSINAHVMSPGNSADARRFFDKKSAPGKVHFEHSWLEEYYRNLINDASNGLRHFDSVVNDQGHGVPPKVKSRRDWLRE